MVRQCTHCSKEQSINNYICEVCSTELVDNGQLIGGLALCIPIKPSTIASTIIPLGLTIASGVAAAALGTHLILWVGIAAVAIYSLKLNKSQVNSEE